MKLKRVVVAGMLLIGVLSVAGCEADDITRLEAEIARIDRQAKVLTVWAQKQAVWSAAVHQKLWPTTGPGDPVPPPPPPPDWQ